MPELKKQQHQIKSWLLERVDLVRSRWELELLASHGSYSNACLYLASKVLRLCEGSGVRTILQAGSASFPLLSKDKWSEDMGRDPHLTYLWNAQAPLTVKLIEEGRMPEIHVWCAMPALGLVIDATTKYIGEQATSMLQLSCEWEPPACFVGDIHDCQDLGFAYIPDEAAIFWALGALHHDPRAAAKAWLARYGESRGGENQAAQI